MSDKDKCVRLVRLLQWLSTPRRWTVNDVYMQYQRLGINVTKRAIQRDFQSLLDADIPLWSEQRGNGREITWSLDRGACARPQIPLLPDEYTAAMLLKSAAVVFKGTPVEEDLQSGLKKLEQFTNWTDEALDAEDNPLIPSFDWIQPGTIDYTKKGDILKDIYRAVREQKLCKITYRGVGQKKSKQMYIEPCRMLYYRGGLYVQVYNTKVKKFFLIAVHRILELNVTDIKYSDHTPEELENAMRDRFGLFEGTVDTVVLEFTNESAPYIADRFWHSSQEFEDIKDGGIRLTMDVSISPELVSWVLSWRTMVKIKAPESLIELVKKDIHGLAKLYR
jgi:predicted DNA-binding transcriptional regulator YafY